MAFPATLELIRVTGKIADWPDGAAAGRVEFSSKAWLIGPTENVIVAPFVASAALDASGSFVLSIPPGNDPQWIPVGWSYELKIVADEYTFRGSIMIPYNQGDVDISDYLVTTTPLPGESYVLLTDIGVPGGIATLDLGGLVPLAQLPAVVWSAITGKPITFPPADVVDSTFSVRKGDNSAGLRFRSTGGAVDVDLMNGDVVFSSFAGPGFAGTQTGMLRFKGGAVGVTLAGLTEFGDTPYAGQQAIDSRAGKLFAKLGGRNGMTPLQFCGRKGTAGAPTTGTWDTNDWVIDSANVNHICTAGGTPGTWT